MAPEQWDRITDFGVSVYDSAGRQVAKNPMRYALEPHHGPAARAAR